MRRLRIGGLGAVLLMGLFVTATWAGDDDEDDAPAKTKTDTNNASWYSRWFGADSGDKWRPTKFKRKTPPRKAEVKKSDDKKGDKQTAKAPEAERAAPLVDDATLRAREEAAYFRRVKVCEELKAIAVRTSDKELERKAQELDERIWNTYAQRTGGMPAGAAGLDADELVLDKHRSPVGDAPAALLPNSAAGIDPNRHAAREEKP